MYTTEPKVRGGALLRRLKQRVAPQGETSNASRPRPSLTGSVRQTTQTAKQLQFRKQPVRTRPRVRRGTAVGRPGSSPLRKEAHRPGQLQLTGRAGPPSTPRLPHDGTRLGGAATAADALHCERAIIELKTATQRRAAHRPRAPRADLDRDPTAPEKLECAGAARQPDSGRHRTSRGCPLAITSSPGHRRGVVSFSEQGPRIFLGRHEVDPDTGRAVIEFGTCSRCGAVHLRRKSTRGVARSTCPEQEGRRCGQLARPGRRERRRARRRGRGATLDQPRLLTDVDSTARTLCTGLWSAWRCRMARCERAVHGRPSADRSRTSAGQEDHDSLHGVRRAARVRAYVACERYQRGTGCGDYCALPTAPGGGPARRRPNRVGAKIVDVLGLRRGRRSQPLT